MSRARSPVGSALPRDQPTGAAPEYRTLARQPTTPLKMEIRLRAGWARKRLSRLTDLNAYPARSASRPGVPCSERLQARFTYRASSTRCGLSADCGGHVWRQRDPNKRDGRRTFRPFVSRSARCDSYAWLGVFATEPPMVSDPVCRTRRRCRPSRTIPVSHGSSGKRARSRWTKSRRWTGRRCAINSAAASAAVSCASGSPAAQPRQTRSSPSALSA